MDHVKTVFAHLGEYKKQSIEAPLFTAGECIMEVLLPFVIALIIDRGITPGDMGQVLLWGTVMLLLALASLFFGVMSSRASSTAAAGFAANLRDAEFEHVQDFSFSNIDRFSSSSLVTRMTTDVTNVQNAYQMALRLFTRAPLTIIASIIMCLLISPGLSLIFVVAIVVLAVLLLLIMGGAVGLFQKLFPKYDAINEIVEENVTAIRVVKAFVRGDYEDEKFSAAAQGLYSVATRASGRMALNQPVMMGVLFGCTLALSWFGAHFVVDGAITTGELTSMFGYTMSILMSLMMLSMVFMMATMSLANVNRIAEVLEEQPDLVDKPNALGEVPDGEIDFDHVSFSYKSGTGESVLADIDLHIKSGETIGVIGPTGSGKSTLVSLIPRLYDATEGTVRVGGHDVRDYDRIALRDAVSVVLQQNELFTGTILDNLRWGNPDATEDECRRACEWAGADEFVSQMPDGYRTRIEQGGSNVSGGQKQRLCIARALLKHPRVLILDDSTSAVDTTTDAHIQDALTNKIPDMTKIVISQRVSSLASADRIVVLDGGHVTNFDTEEHLLEKDEIYRSIYEKQTQGGSGDFDAPAPDDGKDGE